MTEIVITLAILGLATIMAGLIIAWCEAGLSLYFAMIKEIDEKQNSNRNKE